MGREVEDMGAYIQKGADSRNLDEGWSEGIAGEDRA